MDVLEVERPSDAGLWGKHAMTNAERALQLLKCGREAERRAFYTRWRGRCPRLPKYGRPTPQLNPRQAEKLKHGFRDAFIEWAKRRHNLVVSVDDYNRLAQRHYDGGHNPLAEVLQGRLEHF